MSVLTCPECHAPFDLNFHVCTGSHICAYCKSCRKGWEYHSEERTYPGAPSLVPGVINLPRREYEYVPQPSNAPEIQEFRRLAGQLTVATEDPAPALPQPATSAQPTADAPVGTVESSQTLELRATIGSKGGELKQAFTSNENNRRWIVDWSRTHITNADLKLLADAFPTPNLGRIRFSDDGTDAIDELDISKTDSHRDLHTPSATRKVAILHYD